MGASFPPGSSIIPVPVRLHGPEASLRAEAILDTGASYSLIPWSLAQDLGYDPAVSSERICVTTASGTETIPLIRLKALEAMGRRAENLLAGVHDLPPQAKVSALLGLNFLRRFQRMVIDFQAGEVTLE